MAGSSKGKNGDKIRSNARNKAIKRSVKSKPAYVVDFARDAAQCLSVCVLEGERYYSSVTEPNLMDFDWRTGNALGHSIIEQVESGKCTRDFVPLFTKVSKDVLAKSNCLHIQKVVMSPYSIKLFITAKIRRGTNIASLCFSLPDNVECDDCCRLLKPVEVSRVLEFPAVGLANVPTFMDVNRNMIFSTIYQRIMSSGFIIVPPTKGTLSVECNLYTGAKYVNRSEAGIKKKSPYSKTVEFMFLNAWNAPDNAIKFVGSSPSGVTIVSQRSPASKFDWYFSGCMRAFYTYIVLATATCGC